MKTGLQAGFDDAVAPLDVLESLGIQWARVDITDAIDYHGVVSVFKNRSIKPLFLIRDIAKAEPLLDILLPTLDSTNTAIEVFNEPNYNNISEKVFIDGVNAVYHDARTRGYNGSIISGAVGNLNKEGIRYLEHTISHLPPDIVMGFHRYQPGTQTDRKGQSRQPVPWSGFQSRQDELDHLYTIANGRLIACTEFGYHTAQERSCFTDVPRLTNEQARDNLIADFHIYNDPRILMAVVYQWTDGPDPNDFMHTYGIVHVDGSFKPQAEAFTTWQNS